MNYLLEQMPQAVLIDGEAVPINTDFRVCLRIIQALEDERLMEHEKLTVLITLLYPDPPKNTALAIEQGLKFLNLGESVDGGKARQQIVYNLNKDSAYIYTAFKSTFNIDLNTVENLHYWKFRSLFADLGRDCFFNTLISLRSRQHSGKLTDSEKEYSKTLDDCKAKFIAAMDDDLNTAEAIAAIFDIVYASNTALSNENKNAKVVVEKTLDLIHELGGVLGLFQKTQEKSIDAEVEELIEKRNKARSEKNWAEADAIRDKLKAINIELKDTPMGVKWNYISE